MQPKLEGESSVTQVVKSLIQANMRRVDADCRWE